MANAYHDILFSEAAKALQDAAGSREHYADLEDGAVTNDAIGPVEAAFIAARDSLYMASIGPSGWPYVQHRGGPPGFVRVLDPKTLAFVDYVGNRQYISRGNFQTDPRVSLIFMDYPNRRRLKVLGRADAAGRDDPMTSDLQTEGYRAKPDGALRIAVTALEWNCPQHITPRYSEAELRPVITRLEARIAELEARLGEAGP